MKITATIVMRAGVEIEVEDSVVKNNPEFVQELLRNKGAEIIGEHSEDENAIIHECSVEELVD